MALSCKINEQLFTFNGKEYNYNEFRALMYDGLLDQALKPAAPAAQAAATTAPKGAVDASDADAMQGLMERHEGVNANGVSKPQLIGRVVNGIRWLTNNKLGYDANTGKGNRIFVAESKAEYERITKDASGKAKTGGGVAIPRYDADGNYMGADIYINLDTKSLGTVAHELAHVALMEKFAGDPNLFKKFVAAIRPLTSAKDLAYLDKFVRQYADEEVRPEEFLAEMTALIEERFADGEVDAKELSALRKLAEAIKQFINKLTGGLVFPLEKESDVRAFFNALGQSIAVGGVMKEGLAEAAAREVGAKPEVAERREAVEKKEEASQPSRLQEKLNRVSNAADIGNARQIATSQKFSTRRDFKLAVQNAVEAQAAGLDLTKDTPALRKYLIDQILKEAREAIVVNSNAIGWYDEKVTTALDILSILHPEIKTDPKSKFAFVWALAATSNGVKVDKNFELAERAYNEWKNSNSDVDKRRLPTTGIGVGNAAIKIHEALKLYNNLIEKWGFDKFKEFATSLKPNRDIKKEYGRAVSGEGMDVPVYGAGIIGPKIGNGFFMNLYGVFGQLTMDRWWIRMWGRLTGNLIYVDRARVADNKKALLAVVDLIKSDKEATVAIEKLIGARLSKADPVALAKAIAKKSSDEAVRNELKEILKANKEREAQVIDIRGKVKDFTSIGDELRKIARAYVNALDGQIESPSGSAHRQMMREVSSAVLSKLQKEHPSLTMADFQALMWYPEKALYESAEIQTKEAEEAYEDEEAPDYANAAVKLARQKGVSDSAIQGAVEKSRLDAEARRRAGGSGRGSVELSVSNRKGAGEDTGIGIKPRREVMERKEEEAPRGKTASIAPFYRLRIRDRADAERVAKTPAYKNFESTLNDLADAMGVKIDRIKPGVGKWGGIMELSAKVQFAPGQKFAKIREYAAIMGALAPESQDTTIAGEYVKDGDKRTTGYAIRIPTNDVDAAIALAESSGLYGLDIDTESGEAIIFASNGKEVKQARLLAKQFRLQGIGTGKFTAEPLITEFIGEAQRADILRNVSRRLRGEGGRQQGGARLRNLLKLAQERDAAFQRLKGYEPTREKYAKLRNLQIELLEKGQDLSALDKKRLESNRRRLTPAIEQQFKSWQDAYQEAKDEIAKAGDRIAEAFGGYNIPFNIKNIGRATIKTLDWYMGHPTLLGDGARTTIIVDDIAKADEVFDRIKEEYYSPREENYTTDLGYPKRLLEVLTANGRLAEFQVMTPEAYLAKDGVELFPEAKRAEITKRLNKIQSIIGASVPDGMGHLFYELQRDPKVSSSLRDATKEPSNLYYKAFMDPESMKGKGDELMKSIASFMDKFKAEKVNEGTWAAKHWTKNQKLVDKFNEAYSEPSKPRREAMERKEDELRPVDDPRIERVLGGRRMMGESAEDRSRKSAMFKAKDGQTIYLSRSTDSMNPGVMAYVLDGDNSLKPIGSMVVDADQLDNGFVVPASGTRQQSLKVSDKYRRLGVGSAMLDFSEQTYGKPLDVSRIPSSEPISYEAASLFANRTAYVSRDTGRRGAMERKEDELPPDTPEETRKVITVAQRRLNKIEGDEKRATERDVLLGERNNYESASSYRAAVDQARDFVAETYAKHRDLLKDRVAFVKAVHADIKAITNDVSKVVAYGEVQAMVDSFAELKKLSAKERKELQRISALMVSEMAFRAREMGQANAALALVYNNYGKFASLVQAERINIEFTNKLNSTEGSEEGKTIADNIEEARDEIKETLEQNKEIADVVDLAEEVNDAMEDAQAAKVAAGQSTPLDEPRLVTAEQLINDAKAYQSIIEELEEEVKRLDGLLAHANKLYASAAANAASYAQQIADLNREISRKNKLIDKLKDKKNEIAKERDKYKSQLEALKQKVQDLKDINKLLAQKRVGKNKLSTSKIEKLRQKLLSLALAGKLNDPDFDSVFAAITGSNFLTTQDRKAVEHMANALKYFEGTGQREMAQKYAKRLNDFLEKQSKDPWTAAKWAIMIQSWFYNSVLSSIGTLQNALVGSILVSIPNATATSIATALKNPKSGLGAMLYGMRRMLQEMPTAISKGAMNQRAYDAMGTSWTVDSVSKYADPFEVHVLNGFFLQWDKVKNNPSLLAKSKASVAMLASLIAQGTRITALLKFIDPVLRHSLAAHMEGMQDYIKIKQEMRLKKEGDASIAEAWTPYFSPKLIKKIDEMAGVARADRSAAAAQARQEIAEMKSRGISVPLDYARRRASEIMREKRNAEQALTTDKMAADMIMMWRPDGVLGYIWDKAGKTMAIREDDKPFTALFKLTMNLTVLPFLRISAQGVSEVQSTIPVIGSIAAAYGVAKNKQGDWYIGKKYAEDVQDREFEMQRMARRLVINSLSTIVIASLLANVFDMEDAEEEDEDAMNVFGKKMKIKLDPDRIFDFTSDARGPRSANEGIMEGRANFSMRMRLGSDEEWTDWVSVRLAPHMTVPVAWLGRLSDDANRLYAEPSFGRGKIAKRAELNEYFLKMPMAALGEVSFQTLPRFFNTMRYDAGAAAARMFMSPVAAIAQPSIYRDVVSTTASMAGASKRGEYMPEGFLGTSKAMFSSLYGMNYIVSPEVTDEYGLPIKAIDPIRNFWKNYTEIETRSDDHPEVNLRWKYGNTFISATPRAQRLEAVDRDISSLPPKEGLYAKKIELTKEQQYESALLAKALYRFNTLRNYDVITLKAEQAKAQKGKGEMPGEVVAAELDAIHNDAMETVKSIFSQYASGTGDWDQRQVLQVISQFQAASDELSKQIMERGPLPPAQKELQLYKGENIIEVVK